MKLKWKRAKDGQTKTTCQRYWFGVNLDNSGVKLWHADTSTLVGEFTTSSVAKSEAQLHLDGLREYPTRVRWLAEKLTAALFEVEKLTSLVNESTRAADEQAE